MAKLEVFENIGNIPDPDNGKVANRIQLKVNSRGVPVVKYWRKRLEENGIKLQVKVKPARKIRNEEKSVEKIVDKKEGDE